MILEWDERKRASNLKKHGLDFADVRFLDWDNAKYREDTRKEYPEPRYWAFAERAGELHMVVFCLREEAIRIISFRKASANERKAYG